MKLTQSLCVHSIAVSSCNQCVDICPKRAITLSDGSLDLDPALCDDCGLCVGVCPQHVLSNAWEKDLEQASSSDCHISCEFATYNNYGTSIPCIYSIHLDTFTKFVAKDIKKIYLNSGDCKSCPRQQKDNNLDSLNQLLIPYPDKQIKLDFINITNPKQQPKINQPNLSRRSLFFRPIQVFETEGKSAIELLGLNQQTDKLPYIPEIDTENCQACHACSQICPHQAIVFAKDEQHKQYQIFPENCNNCGLCVDICQDDAIKVYKNKTFKQSAVTLNSNTCVLCRIEFYITDTHNNELDICPTCKITPKRQDRVVME